jgi:hypothetical protein
LPKKTYNKTLLFGITPLKHGRYFDYRNQPLKKEEALLGIIFFSISSALIGVQN